MGKYLVFMPVDGAEAGLFESREIRAWSAKDVAPTMKVIKDVSVGPPLVFEILEVKIFVFST